MWLNEETTGKRYTGYFYDPARDLAPGFDSNELSINGKFVSMITEVRSSCSLEKLKPQTETEEVILIVPDNTNINILNFNPCPEEF